MNTIKKLTRPRNGRMLGGVCAGIGEYLGIDPTVVRSKTPYVAVLLSTGAAFLTVVVNYYAPAKVFKFLIDSSGAIALLVYLVLCFVIPESY